ncbi:MAG: hypothetical protein AAF108_11980 [Planctomycetota bacterium]
MEVEHAAVVVLGSEEIGGFALDAFGRVGSGIRDPRFPRRPEVGSEHPRDVLAAWHREHGGAGHRPGDVIPEFPGQLGSDVLPCRLSVLCLASFEQDVGAFGIEHERCPREAPQLAGPEARLNREFVEQAAGVPVYTHSIRAVVGCRPEPSPLIDGQESAFPLAGWGRFLHAGEGVDRNAFVRDAPPGEGPQGRDVLVGRARGPCLRSVAWGTLSADEPFKGFRRDVSENYPFTDGRGRFNHLPRLGDVSIGAALGAFRVVEGVEV